MSAAELEREFEARRARLPGSGATLERRRAALEEFVRKGFPTRRDEDWRYTDLKPIASGPFAYGSGREKDDAALESPRRAVAPLLASETRAGARVVFIDGRLDEASSRLAAPAGVEIVRLASDPDRFGAALARRTTLDGHPLAALNTAFSADGVSIRVGRGAVAEAPVHLYFVGCESGLAEQPRVAIDLAASASLRVVVHCLDADSGRPTASWRNVVTHATLGDGARLSFYRLQELGAEFLETSLLAAELGKDARLEAAFIDAGGRLVRNDVDVRLLEPGAGVSLFGVFVAGGGSHIDNHTKIEHVAPHTTSDESFRGIADAGGRGVFNGKVIVHPGAQRTDARQSSQNLLLADGAEIDTKPELEIYADDVKCSHGATVGELDAEQVFYLRARGIDEPAARALLTFAFANALLARIEPAELRERAASRIAGRLPGAASADCSAEIPT